MIDRKLESVIRKKMDDKDKKVIVIYGARQVGKTTLLNKIFKNQKDTYWLNGDESTTQSLFENFDVEKARRIVGDAKTIVIDEAQKIENIGLKLKILYDNFGDKVQFIATGSSSFDLANKINEPLTGRKWVYRMFSLSIEELVKENGYVKENSNLENRLIYGSYPAVINNPANAEEILKNLANDNLYRDILNFGEIIKTDYLQKILQALAFQIGSQVNINEISNLLGIDRKTVDKYISLLEQSFVIFRLKSYNKNLRNELKKSQKIYFYDLGIRNALINDFRPAELRNDLGDLFENYIVAEFEKKKYSLVGPDSYFWRTTDGQEVDYILSKNGELKAYEMKWKKMNVRFPESFINEYTPASIEVINRDNYIDFFVE